MNFFSNDNNPNDHDPNDHFNSNPFRNSQQPDLTNLEKSALLLSISGFIFCLSGCCCNTYLLIVAAVLDIAAITVALISRQQTGNHLSKAAITALSLAASGLIISIAFTVLYASIISNTELMKAVDEYYKGLGIDLQLAP